MKFSIPNILTIIRLLLVPATAVSIGVENYTLAAIFFGLAGVTDVVDGFLARKLNQITYLGKILDPLADKLLTIVTFFMLALKMRIFPTIPWLNWLLPIILVVKDFAMLLGGLLVIKRANKVKSSNWYGKIATFIFFFATIFIMFDSTALFGRILFILGFVSAVIAFSQYVKLYISIQTGKAELETDENTDEFWERRKERMGRKD